MRRTAGRPHAAQEHDPKAAHAATEGPQSRGDWMMGAAGALAISLCLPVLAGAIAVSHRYVLVNTTNGITAARWKVDQWTGETYLCAAAATPVVCLGPVPTEAK
jgi:hypothetical protein